MFNEEKSVVSAARIYIALNRCIDVLEKVGIELAGDQADDTVGGNLYQSLTQAIEIITRYTHDNSDTTVEQLINGLLSLPNQSYDDLLQYIKQFTKTSFVYLLNVTFYTGSDAPEDVDKALFIMKATKPFSQEQVVEIFDKVNQLLMDQDADFPYSYEDGINIDTLIQGVEHYTNTHITKINHYSGNLDDIFTVSQWQ